MELKAAMRTGLVWAALGLVDSPSSVEDLAHRFVAEGAIVSSDRCRELLGELRRLGLVWVSDGEASEVRYVRTPIGDRLAVEGRGEGDGFEHRLAELERLRSNLFTTVAHELRTPLTAIRSAVGLLLDPATRADPEQRRQMLQTIERNAERLQRLANSALELARFRAGELRLQLRRFDAREVGDEVRVAMAPLLQARAQRLTLMLPSEPVWVFADHRRIERAVLNLVANANKFSPRGSAMRISVRSNGDDVVWEVADSGRGISEAEQARLFERFFVSATARSAAGSGLGLPIVLATAQAHGGRVEVESELGRGSVFRIVIPAVGLMPDDR